MKRKKRTPEDLVTEHIVVTQEVFSDLWKLRYLTGSKRLSDVIKMLIAMSKAITHSRLEGDDSL